jgi:hypothetical protein
VKLQLDLYRKILEYFQALDKELPKPVLTILSDGIPTDKYEDVLVELEPLLAGKNPAIVSIVGAIPPSDTDILKKFVNPGGNVFQVTPTSIPSFLTAVSKTLVASSRTGNTKDLQQAYDQEQRAQEADQGEVEEDDDGAMKAVDFWALPQDKNGAAVAKPGIYTLADMFKELREGSM